MYTPTPISMALARPEMSALILLTEVSIGALDSKLFIPVTSAGKGFRAVGETPEWLAQNGHKAPTDFLNTPFTQVYGMSLGQKSTV